MITILLHTSKTMKIPDGSNTNKSLQLPQLISQAKELLDAIVRLDDATIASSMKISLPLASKVKRTFEEWTEGKGSTLPVLDIFRGDIYSGLQSATFTNEDRAYANEHLRVLSGLYGVLRALDEIKPYRLEMGYKFPSIPSLYHFWGDEIARTLPKNQPLINLSSVEYTKAIFPHFKNIDGLKDIPIVTPRFLTVSPKTGEPTFVTVHAKVARGAFARWLIQNRIEELNALKNFNEIGYSYSENLSSLTEPVFVAQTFGGLGLSVRLK